VFLLGRCKAFEKSHPSRRTVGGGGNYNFPSCLNAIVLSAVALFLAAAFFVTYSEPNESDAAADPGSFGIGLTAVFAGSALTISGDGDMDNYSVYIEGKRAPWYSYRENIESIIIKSGMTSIGNDAFRGCTALTSVTISGTVKSIGSYAFRDCAALTSVKIPDGTEFIGDYAFGGCTALGSVEISGTVEHIGEDAFWGCSKLTSVNIPDSVTFLGNWAFQACTALTSVTIPSKVESIGTGVFTHCHALTTITIPGNVKSIGDSAFSWSGLTRIVMHNEVTQIGDRVFEYCAALTSIIMPDGLTIGTDAFSHCDSLTSVTVTGGLTDGDIAANGIIDTYFRTYKDWTLPHAPNAAKYLYLPDFSSSDYDPNNTDKKGGIEGAEGRELYYSDTEFTWNSITRSWETDGYTVSLIRGTGISGFRYSINGDTAVPYEGPFDVNLGDTLTITALPSGGYAFDKWSAGGQGSSVQDSKSNPLTVSEVTDVISLTASGYPIQYNVAFDSGSMVYVNGSPTSSSPVTVTEGESIVFTVNASEGYSAYPSIVSGNAKITPQIDGRYRISEIHSDVRVNITANTVSGDGSGIGSNGSDTDYGSSNTSYWAPAAIVTAFIGCIAAVPIAKFGLFGIKLFGR
jgi:hypothetical protein